MTNQLTNSTQTLENAGSDTGLARELADLFLTTSLELSAELQDALNTGDLESLARTAHTFKSPLGFFGANISVELAQTIESHSDAGTSDGLNAVVAQLLADVDKVRSELQQSDF